MTELEAMKKWCPMTRVHTGCTDYVTAANRNLLDRDKGKENCIGSGCMMWKWEPEMINVATANDGIFMRPTGKRSEHGYCGLAGK